MKKIAVVGTGDICEAIKKHLKDVNVECFSELPDSLDYDLIALVDCPNPPQGRVINLHPSLLPAFEGEDAMKRAFLAGVKVSGVTVHWTDGKIIAQYPVLIGNLTHFDEFEREIHAISKALYPVVIEKILNDEVFDFSDLLGGGKCMGHPADDGGGGCKGCGGCGGKC